MNFFEKDLIEAFLKAMDDEKDIPKDLAKSIRELSNSGKLTQGTGLKKILEDYIPQNEVKNETN